jgi:hypothetical protein
MSDWIILDRVEPAASPAMSAMPRWRPEFAAQGNVAMGQQPTSLAHWTRSIHFTKNHSFHVG